MKKAFLLFLINSYFIPLYSQNIKIYDIETNRPVSFVTVSYFKNDSFIDSDYCDENGFVVIKNKDFNKIDFSCIGYETKSIIEISNVDTIFLKKKIITLNEVVIQNKKKSFSFLGHSTKKRKISISGSKGFEICEFIENPYKTEKTIKSFLFKIKRRKDYKTAVRIHFYKKLDTKLEPNNEILKQDVVYYFDGKIKELVEVDVSNYNIELPSEGAFIGIEWLGILNEKGDFVEDLENWNDTSIELNDEISNPITFIKSRYGQTKWHNTEKMKADIAKFKNFPNASFGIKIFD
jgi:hypothetical protein